MANDVKNKIIEYVEEFERERKEMQKRIEYLEQKLEEGRSGKCVNCLQICFKQEEHSHCLNCFSLICERCDIKLCLNCRDRIDFLNSF